MVAFEHDARVIRSLSFNWMRNALNDQAVWTLQGGAAQLRCEKISALVDVSRPDCGLHKVTFDGIEHAADLLRVYRAEGVETSWPLPVAESYLRASDLVASYQATDGWPFSPQLYWRANSLSAVDGVMASASLLVSVQTHLLDTLPQIGVASRVPCDEMLIVSVDSNATPIDSSRATINADEDCCVVMRLADLRLSYLEIMPAGDFHAAGLRRENDRSSFEWRLFAEFLEKGVIRRARIHAAIVPRDNDIDIAAACCRAIDKLDLPLTT